MTEREMAELFSLKINNLIVRRYNQFQCIWTKIGFSKILEHLFFEHKNDKIDLLCR